MWDYNKGLSTHVIKVPEGEEKEGGRKSIFQTTAENFPNLVKHRHFQETEQTPNKNSKNSTV